MQEKRIYLDWAAATPLLPEAKVAMLPFLEGDFGNASAIHQEGQVARRAVENARDGVARVLQVRPEFITFTSGGTEANNLAILGSLEAMCEGKASASTTCEGKASAEMEVITTRIEHPSVMNTMSALKRRGVVVKYVDVDEEGVVELAHLRELLSEKTVLFSVAYANSEIGVVQKLHGIKKVLREAEETYGTKIMFHLDAAQAPLWLNCQFGSTGADVMVLDAGKFCGPKGVGVLVRSRRVELVAAAFGGGQEAGLRPGTENVAGIVGAAVALEVAQSDWCERAKRARSVRDGGIKGLLETIPNAILNGPTGEDRLANNINISILGFDTEYAAVWLDSKGFAVSTKSACSGAGGGESTVVKATSADAARAASTLRFTIGPGTTNEDLHALVTALMAHCALMRGLTH
ncbi:cysteine desulfurase [Candidatus Nomurabacteria bacterium]|nr:cysteine desulfurase [Candidatus Nomurabacteria bacterium]